ncbi:MAG TPA: amino acid adenylation domain-containing protein, partial [Candidatus Deferrimicrobium sp.]|nr:amino acid adenylation domain-containing protein [Candidatus Deferrimicrobium sp.]
IEYQATDTFPQHGQTRTFIRAFDLAKAPLIRVGLIKTAAGQALLMVDMHHIISDGVSLTLLVKEFLAIYEGRELAPLRLQYKDYASWQIHRQEKLNKQETYWLNELGGEIPVLDIPLDFERPKIQGFTGSTVSFELDSDDTRALNSLALKQGTTLYMVLLAIYNIFLAKITNYEDIIVGTPTAGRLHSGVEQLIGVFINTLALKNVPYGEKCFHSFLAEVKENSLRAFENQEYPYEELVEKLNIERNTGRNPLFDTMFVLQNLDFPAIEIPGLKLKPFPYERGTSKLDLTFVAVEMDQRLSFTVEYAVCLFKQETVLRFSDYYKKVVSAILANPDVKISEIEIISAKEKEQVLFHFNSTAVDYPQDKTIHQLFIEQAEKVPDHMALVGAGPRVCPNSLTYRQLNEQSDRLAQLLITKGVLPDTIVGIMVERSIEMIIGIMGILKSDGAYLPIDPKFPPERIDYMLKDSRARVLNFENLDFEFVSNFDIRASNFNPSNLAYIIYTSGSTGRPKGVLVEHASVVNLIFSRLEQFGVDNRDRILQFSSFCFDASVEQIFIALAGGAVLVLIDENVLLDPDKFAAFLAIQSITHIDSVPSFLNNIDFKPMAGLKRIISGGEVCSLPLAEKLSGYADFYNQYGPTETTVTAVAMKFKDGTRGSVPVGKPIANTVVYLFDRFLKPVPTKVSGELYIGGKGVARGYLNQPELTAEKFIDFHHSTLYRTGDLARWLPGGNLQFLGRIDHQVKIRGFRIEPGEIENRLLKHPGIKEAVVLMQEKEEGEKYLCAYIVPGNEYEVAELREFLAGELPVYMIPSYFVGIKKIPLTPNGKIDRRALPKPGFNVADHYIAPRNEIEKKLVVLWAEILGIDSSIIGIDDNFFHLGGHSLKATQLTARVHRTFNVKISLVDLFKDPTIRGTAAAISKTEVALFTDIKKAEKKDFYDLSFNQKRLWFIQQMNPAGSSFNMPGRLLLNHPVEEEWIEKTLVQLMHRHESLRTGFKIIADQPVQYIIKEAPIPLKIIDISMMAGEEKQGKQEEIYKETAGTPFDLTKAPLFRAVLLKLDIMMYEFIFNMHHIITDGWSMEIIKRDFNLIYEGYRGGKKVELESMPFQYTDFVEWYNDRLQNPVHKAGSHSYWKAKIKNGIPGFTLPGDFTGERESRVGAGYYCFIEKDIAERIRRLAAKYNTTLFTVMFSIYILLLSRLSGEEEVACSIIGAGREHVSLQAIVGFFVNSIIYNSRMDFKTPFANFLEKVKDETLELFQH